MVNIAEVFPGKTRLLVVDDDSDLRLTLCEYLESRNFTVSSARNGNEAINLLQSRKATFDIIFTDLVMPPGPDGMEVLRVAKELNPFCYVVVMTGYSSIETAIESYKAKHGTYPPDCVAVGSTPATPNYHTRSCGGSPSMSANTRSPARFCIQPPSETCNFPALVISTPFLEKVSSVLSRGDPSRLGT